jgi:hypothetical protein
MDENTVRARAEAHAQAMVAGDLNRAASDLSPEAMENAGAVMRAMPRPVTDAEVLTADADGDAIVCKIRYSGETREATVASRWQDQNGELKIVKLDLA